MCCWGWQAGPGQQVLALWGALLHQFNAANMWVDSSSWEGTFCQQGM